MLSCNLDMGLPTPGLLLEHAQERLDSAMHVVVTGTPLVGGGLATPLFPYGQQAFELGSFVWTLYAKISPKGLKHKRMEEEEVWLQHGDRVCCFDLNEDGGLDVHSIATTWRLDPSTFIIEDHHVTVGEGGRSVRSINKFRSVERDGSSKLSALRLEARPAGRAVKRHKPVPLSEYTPQGILGLANAAASVETHIAEGGKFWILDTDPLGNYREPFLIWKRKAYETLETVITNWVHEDQRIFIVLGTAGTGKSFFGYHWVMRLGEQGHEQVLYKVKKQVHILNLRNGAVQGPYGEDHPVIMEMLDDKSIWLVIDGKQKGPLPCLCKVLLVCSTKKSNYEEFGKNMDACKLYLSVWSKEEIEMFMDDFECHRKSYKGMKVLEKTSALAAFDYLGGVPRYVLHRIKLVEGIQRTRMAVDELGSSVDKAAQVLAGAHIKQLSDCILHIFASDDHKEIVYGFASEKLMIELGEKYLQAGYTQTVHFLKTTINCPWVGALWGKLYEPLVHRLLSKGGKFLTKQVYEDGRVGPDQYRLIPAHNFIEASSARDLAGSMVIGNYVKPISEVFPSIDAAMDEDILVQIFKREDGKHGFKAKGLELVDCVLKRPRYELWLCVPLETYPRTGWQKWKNEKNGVYGKSNPLFQKMEQYVVEVDYRKSES